MSLESDDKNQFVTDIVSTMQQPCVNNNIIQV